MKISVIVPSFNQGRFIKKTIDSILDQDGVDKEILVMDGGSSDETLDILKQYNNLITWVSEPDRGQAHAINKGLKNATGDIHCFLNSDDVYYPGALKRAIDCFQQNKSIRIIYGNGNHIDEYDRHIEDYYNEPWDYERLLKACYICQPATFWRREITEHYGCLDETLHYSLDYDYWLRIGSCEPLHYLEGEKLAGSRMYPDNKTMSQKLPALEEALKVVRRYTPQPYTWLTGLAYVMASDEFEGKREYKTALNILKLAGDHSILLNKEILDKVILKIESNSIPIPCKKHSTKKLVSTCNAIVDMYNRNQLIYKISAELCKFLRALAT